MDLSQLVLQLAADQSMSAQWRDVIASLPAQLAAAVGDETTRLVLRQVGRDVADRHPLPPCDSLDDLGRAMSEVLGRMRWGLARAEEGERNLVIQVAGYPQIARNEPALALVVAVLEGMIGRWMESQGGGVMLSARFAGKGEPPLSALTFHYGQHG